ncbi:hypothetical protein DHEL01_v202869 [Diaporthe helianthi]|uniref:Peptidase S8/S53 domain-containing protein n=1 Tax=Diaporthe helianthi TaxID=158607 RepID=A0A2P5I8B7_DIAHE|nr:hypothetical protein DHEL01_v202869 [Diaporthe helianthi]
MSGLALFLGLSAYFFLACALPLDDLSPFVTNSFDPKNISDSHMTVTDNTAADFLTLLSAQYDANNPNPVDKGYVRDDSDGKGTTIFVLDSGFNLERYPDEQCLDQRRIDTFVLEQHIRSGGPLTQEETNNGDYLPTPDNMDDIADLYGDELFHGHGTPVAIVAAGCKTGVARKANLYLVKISELIMNSGLPRTGLNGPNNMLYGLHHVLSVLNGYRGLSIPRGKAIVLISLAVERRQFLMERHTAQDYNAMETDFKMVLDALDRQGATVIMAAGNGGNEPVPSFVDDSFPQHLATQDSPYIIVGSTNNKGQLSSFSSPGRGNVSSF